MPKSPHEGEILTIKQVAEYLKVTANYDKVDTFAQSSGDQVFEGPTRGPANIIDWRALIPIEAA